MKINIYISKNNKDLLSTIQQKYKISVSTIVDILMETTLYCLHHFTKEKTKFEELELFSKYLEENMTKTSCKPKNAKEIQMWIYGNEKVKGNITIYASNCLIIYLEKKTNNYFTDEGIKYYNTKVNKEFQKRKEEFYNYNNTIRSTMRFIKTNKDYLKWKIESLERKNAD